MQILMMSITMNPINNPKAITNPKHNNINCQIANFFAIVK